MRARIVSRILGSILAVGCVTSGSATEPVTPAAPAPPDGPFKEILAAHNHHRARHCAPPLRWSPEIAQVAQAWADGLARRGCVLVHSSGRYGENLAAGTTGTLSPARVVDLWYSEVKQYRFERPGFSMQTGHFTQVVWAGTQRLGCAVARCSDQDVWVCNYDPPGNVQGKERYERNVLPTSCRR